MPIDPSIIDPAALQRLEDWGGTKLSHEIVRLFLDNGPSRVDQIRGAMDEDDLEVPERGAHSLKSSAANVGAQILQQGASDLEMAASGGDIQLVRELIPNLEQAFAHREANAILLLSDGGPYRDHEPLPPGPIHDMVGMNNKTRKVIIDTFGFSEDADKGFLKKLASDNGGTFKSIN